MSLQMSAPFAAMAKICGFHHEHPGLTPQDSMTQLVQQLQTEEARLANAQQQARAGQAHGQGPGQPGFNPTPAGMAQAQAFQQQQMQHQAQLQQQAGQFLSPAQAAQMNLPNAMNTASPNVMSNQNPALQNLALQHQQQQVQAAMGMAGPPGAAQMAHQASYQGTNPSNAGTPAGGGSANASPNVNVTGKRRRPSGVNLGGGEDGMDGPQMNGIGAAGGPGGPVGTGGGPTSASKAVKASPRIGGGGQAKRQKQNA